MSVSDLTPNRSLKNAIADHLLHLTRGVVPSRQIQGNSVNTEEKDAEQNIQNFSEAPCISLNISARPLIFQEDSVVDREKSEFFVKTSLNVVGNNTMRVPSDIVLVVDVSGSMASEAKTQTVSESMGLSLLDIVKHAIKTVVTTLGPDDRLSLVSFSTSAKVIFELMPMNRLGKQNAFDLIKKLEPDGMTNLWDGLNKGLNILSNRQESSRNAAILLLTDGEPNIEPPRGHIPMLKKYRDAHQSCYPGLISTFGFGYTLDSALLSSIAQEGGGMYAFIPDAGFVGTVFVNNLSNILCTVVKDTQLRLELSPSVSIVTNGIINKNQVKATSWGASAVMGSAQMGQSQDVVLHVSAPLWFNGPLLSASLTYKCTGVPPDSVRTVYDPSTEESSQEIDYQRFRLLFVTLIDNLLSLSTAGKTHEASRALNLFIVKLTDWLDQHAVIDVMTLGGNQVFNAETYEEKKPYKKIAALLQDCEGQVTEALSRPDWFQKWGRHYLPSLQRAHSLQQCNNFKDPGIQNYGGSLFRSVRDEADDVFCSMPPPEGSLSQATATRSFSATATATAQRQPVAAPVLPTMAAYMDRGGGCFHENCTVALLGGQLVAAKHLKKGDVLSDGAVVQCVLKTLCPDGQSNLVSLPGPADQQALLISAYHPVKREGRWTFPKDIAPPGVISCGAVYSVLLQGGSSLLVEGIEVVALAHGLTDPVAAHGYLGTRRVEDDLRRCAGWEAGLVVLCPTRGQVLLRDESGMVCGINMDAQLL